MFAYPYSTRELVNVVRHLQQFPQDGLMTALNNVLSFDVYDSQVLENLRTVFREHGIPLGATLRSSSISLAPVRVLCRTHSRLCVLPPKMFVLCTLQARRLPPAQRVDTWTLDVAAAATCAVQTNPLATRSWKVVRWFECAVLSLIRFARTLKRVGLFLDSCSLWPPITASIQARGSKVAFLSFLKNVSVGSSSLRTL